MKFPSLPLGGIDAPVIKINIAVSIVLVTAAVIASFNVLEVIYVQLQCIRCALFCSVVGLLHNVRRTGCVRKS